MKMQRTISGTLAVLLLATAAYAAFENRTAQRAHDAYEREMQRVEEEYQSARQRVARQYRRELNRAMLGAMQNRIDNEVVEIREAIQRLDFEQASFEQQVVGKRYEVNDGPDYLQLNADGTLHQSRGRNGHWEPPTQNEVVAYVGDERSEWRIVFSADRTYALIIREPGRTPSVAKVVE